MCAHQLQHDEDRSELRWGVWRRMVGHARPYRPQLLGLGVAGVLVAGIESCFPLITGLVIDEATTDGFTSRLLWLAGGYIAGIVAFSFFVWLFIVLAGQIATGVAYGLREKGFAKLQELSFSYYNVRPVGWLMSRLTADISKLSSLIPWFMLDLVWGSCFILGMSGMMLWLDWQLGLVVLSIVPPLIIVSLIFQQKLLHSSRMIRRTNSQLTASFNEELMGVRTTKALVREEANLGEFQVHSTAMYQHSMRNALQSAVYLPLVISLGAVGVGLALWRGGVTVGGGLTLGTLVAFMQYAGLFYMPIQELARRFTDLQNAQAAAERVLGLLDTEPKIQDSSDVLRAITQQEGSPTGGAAIDGFEQRIETIEFRDVDFWYIPDEPVLRGFNLTVRAGQTIALVGPTGGGKSTIVSLIARFYEPTGGGIFLNGTEYRSRSLHWLQSSLGVVLQTPHLFRGTIRENIRYGRLEASDAEVVEAAKLVNADEFIETLDNGYDSQVGEGGSRLSTGQRQLLSLARAVLADPQIFIMDEATSSVDTETERLIQDAVETVLRDRIAFVIAHRLSTIRSADVILVIDGGEIVERGSHEELIGQRGRYFALYTKQFAGDGLYENV